MPATGGRGLAQQPRALGGNFGVGGQVVVVALVAIDPAAPLSATIAAVARAQAGLAVARRTAAGLAITARADARGQIPTLARQGLPFGGQPRRWPDEHVAHHEVR